MEDLSGFIEFLSVIFYIIWSLGWGFATAAVRERRGYGRRWFWFGFFLWYIPFIIACAIPKKRYDYLPFDPNANFTQILGSQQEKILTGGDGWQCSCGRSNAAFVSTCICGLSKRQNMASAGDNTANQEN